MTGVQTCALPISAVSLRQHQAIVAAVTARDPAAAERAMHEHLQSVIEALQALAGPAARR